MSLNPVTLDDRYDLGKSRIFVTGYQALVRLTLMQKERDRRAGLNTAGYITGYRGSPLGGLDQQFTRAAKVLKPNDIVFQAGLNEELAATAVWGTQAAELRGEGKFDGVFSIWYGKGPGIDRSGDVFRHANSAGSSRHGGVLALMGDDHTAESSTAAHQSEFQFIDVMIPILSPAGVQELLDYGLYGWAMSRFTGTWVALKCVHETVESTAVIDGSMERVKIVMPDDFCIPDGGLNIRLGDTIADMEARLHEYKRDAMLAFVRANKLNRTVISGGRDPKIGIIAPGKSYLDVRQALDELSLDEIKCNDFGIRLYKVACPWPLSQRELREFADGLQLIVVVEEKRPLIEAQVRGELYGTADQPVCIGKRDERGDWLFPVKGALDSNDMAICIGERLLKYERNEAIAVQVARLKEAQLRLARMPEIATRTPYFCSGCPHNTSTAVPEGMRAYAGIGCHFMAQWMDRRTLGFTQMGGEGANWIGEAPFSKRAHIFQNLGDGTYNHSGYLAIRGAVASGANITYKILFNDAVAMTGGQRNDGGLSVPMIARQVAAGGVNRIVVVTDEPEKYPRDTEWPAGLTIRHRDELMPVQTELAAVPGVSVLIYDQTCAAEKRRRRKRRAYPDPDKRVVINDLVCEGCGDCGVKSNCVSLQPVETEFGRKRTVDQSSCNKDYSCIKGFCPSFVVVHGAKLRADTAIAEPASLPLLGDPSPPALPAGGTYSIIVAGIGGTGVVTIGAVLGMAAHLEGRGCGIIDMAGLAQKGGAVLSYVRIAERSEDIHAIRLAAGSADLLLGGDIVVAGSKKVLAAMKPGARMVVNVAEFLPGDFTRNPDFSFPAIRLKHAIVAVADVATGGERAWFLDATRLARVLTGNSIASNMFLLGYAYQRGGVPLSAGAIEQAIGLNGEAVAMNQAAFRWGRLAAIDLAAIEALALPRQAEAAPTLDETIALRVKFLTAYQNAAYAARYLALVERCRAVEAAKVPGKPELAHAVARSLFRLMAYKDEYEVARLHSEYTWTRVRHEVSGDNLRLEFHLAPPLFARRDAATGEPRKMSFGPWIMPVFHALARFRFLRGTVLDPFGYTTERHTERALIGEYERLMDEVLDKLTPDNHHLAVALASLPEKIRGFGHIKMRNLSAAKAEGASLLDQYHAGPAPMRKVAG
jgi:indolepyruvate ferredoxin oxidoreductase